MNLHAAADRARRSAGRAAVEENVRLSSDELMECTTGKVMKTKTRFSLFWSGDALYFGIRCDETKPDFLDPAKFPRLNGYAPPASWEKEKQRRSESKAAPEA